MTDADITAAAIKHGAKRVHDAAFAAMAGRRSDLATVGLPTNGTLGDLNHIATVAFGLMGHDARAADLADASIKAAKL